MIRRFVNIVAENYQTGLYSLHRLDVFKHLFHQSRADARVLPFLAEAQDITGVGEQPKLERLQELPSATTKWSRSNVDYFSLLSSRHNESRILCTNKMGAAVLYDSYSNCAAIMPGLSEFKGPVHVSVFVDRADAKEEDLYIMHGGSDGLEFQSKYRFDVLRFGSLHRWYGCQGWYWQSLPLPPFVEEPQNKPALISSHTVVDGGHTICLSSVAEGIGTYYFDTVSCEWKGAGDWVLPFTGRADYIPHLKLWLGFSLHSPGYLCAASGLSDMLMDQQPMSQIVWPDHTPKEWMAARVNLVNLGSGMFAIAKVFKVPDTVGDEFVVLTGVKLTGEDDNNQQGLKLFQHKSIIYTCANSTSIHCVL